MRHSEENSRAISVPQQGVANQLVEFLLGTDERAAAAAHSLSEAESWRAGIALAQAWKITPQLSARIQRQRIKLNAQDTWALRKEFLRVHAQTATRVAGAIVAIRALQQAGIPVAAFKGIASMAVLYGDQKHRSIGDADLLIPPHEVQRAIECLEREGFARKGEETLAEYLAFVQNAPRFAGNRAMALYGADGTEIDLHWDLAGSGLRIAELLGRSRTVLLMNSPIPVVDSKDGFLLTVHHAIREDLGVESVCRDLLDARLWCHHLNETKQFQEAMEWTSRTGFRVAALTVTSLLCSYDGTKDAARASEILRGMSSAAECRSAARLTELFHYQMSNGRLGKDVLYLVHSRPLRQILKGLGTDWSGYRRSMQTLEENLGEQLPLHKRAALLVRSLPGLQGLKLARELARVKYRTE
jgi:Uncharacterised nucleotidyltransferase